MKSAIQAELRFSQAICASCRHCIQRQAQSTRRSFHTAHRPRTTQAPLNVTSLGRKAISDDATARENVPPEEKSGTVNEESPHHVSEDLSAPATVSSTTFPRTSNYHGSPARRRLRSRLSKETESETPATEAWKDSNISLWGVDIHPGRSSRVHTVAADLITGEPLEQSFAPDAGGASPPRPGSENAESRQGQDAEGEEMSTHKHESVVSSTVEAPSKMPASSKYYIVDEQYDEVIRSARGLLQIIQSQSQATGIVPFRDHLHLQYTGTDGDILLDHLVEDVARKLGCDLMIVDAQDIADLISQNHSNQTTAKAGRMLSYEVLTSLYPDLADSSKHEQSAEEEEDDDDEDLDDMFDEVDSSPNLPRIGIPILAARSGDIFKSLSGRMSALGGGSHSEGRGGIFRTLSDIVDPQKTREDGGALSGLVYKMLKTISDRPSASTSPEAVKHDQVKSLREKLEQQTGVAQGAVIVHVRGFKAMGTSAIGGAFINNLQKQLAQRRSKGEGLLLIGTDSFRANEAPLTRESLKEFQAGWPERRYQSITLTPVLPNTTSKLALLHDRKQRIAAINMRHLWEMLRSWKPSVFAHLSPGFWRQDFFHQITPSDKACLEGHVWSYQYVHRLATYIAGAAPSEEATSTDVHPVPVISAAISHLDHSDNTKMRWVEKQSKESKKEVPERHLTKENRLAKIRANASKYEKRLLNGIIEAKNINTTFDDVHMPVETIDALQTLTTLSLTRPDAFKYGILASNKIPGLLLYGPPGTGKTLAAKAVAKESGATMLEVSAADLNDMYVGESEKNVRAVFSLAKKLTPCVVFLDEADAMFRSRSNQGPRVSHREQLNQFLKEWDGMSNDSGSAFIMVATNRPMDIDEAVLRRLPRRLLVDLPSEADRLAILKIHLRHENAADDVNVEELAKKTPFYSGSDLKNVAVAAALNAVRDENELAKKHTGEEPYQYPNQRILTKQHFDKALEEISASISEDMSSLREIKKFDEQYGDKRGKKKKIPRLGFPVDKENEKARDTVKVRD